MLCRFQQVQGRANDGHLLLTMMGKTKRTPHNVRRDQRARWLEQFRIRAKCFDVDTHRWNANRFYCTRYMTHGHMTDGSARGQKDGLHAIILE
jgi:hypothetical protein